MTTLGKLDWEMTDPKLRDSMESPHDSITDKLTELAECLRLHARLTCQPPPDLRPVPHLTPITVLPVDLSPESKAILAAAKARQDGPAYTPTDPAGIKALVDWYAEHDRRGASTGD
jgi:hypothetical protein